MTDTRIVLEQVADDEQGGERFKLFGIEGQSSTRFGVTQTERLTEVDMRTRLEAGNVPADKIDEMFGLARKAFQQAKLAKG